MATEVILTAEIENLGGQGEAVRVAEGYARNFLLPRGLAIMATAGNLKRIEALRKKREAALAAKREEATTLAEKLAKITCTISVPVGADGKLFGSVTAADIAERLKANGLEIDRKKLVLEHPLKHIGEVEVDVKLSPEVTAKLKVNVTPSAATATEVKGSAPAQKAAAKPKPAATGLRRAEVASATQAGKPKEKAKER